MTGLMQRSNKAVLNIVAQAHIDMIKHDSTINTKRRFVMVIANKIAKLGYSLSESLKYAWKVMHWMNPVRVITAKKESVSTIDKMSELCGCSIANTYTSTEGIMADTYSYIKIPGFKIKRERIRFIYIQ